MSSVHESGQAGVPQPLPQTAAQIREEIGKAAAARQEGSWKNKSVFSKEYLVLGDGNRVECRPLTTFEHFKALFGYGPKLTDVIDQAVALHPDALRQHDFDILTSHYLDKKFEKLNDKLKLNSSAELSNSECISAIRIITRANITFNKISQPTQETISKVGQRIKDMHANDLLDLVKTAVEAGREEEAAYLLGAGGANNRVDDRDSIILLFEIMKFALNKEMYTVAELLMKNISLDQNADYPMLLKREPAERDKLFAKLSSLCEELRPHEGSAFDPKKYMKAKIKDFENRFRR